MLHRATGAKVVGTARLSSTVSLALDHLSADVPTSRRVLGTRLVKVQLGLDVVMVNAADTATALMMQACHLNVLNLRLIDARTLAGEELLLV